MPFKHKVTDSRGNVHTRTSASRQYGFAAVVHLGPFVRDNGQVWPGRSFANWSRDEKLALASNNRYRHSAQLEGTEIIPCTPVPTGKHAKQEPTT